MLFRGLERGLVSGLLRGVLGVLDYGLDHMHQVDPQVGGGKTLATDSAFSLIVLDSAILAYS